MAELHSNQGAVMNSVDQLLGIKGRLAMIVGAAGGYGRQCALTLAENGANVALIDRNQDELEKTQAMVLAGNPGAFTAIFNSDISSVDNCDQLIKDVYSKFNRIDILVHTAAVLQNVLPEDVDEEHWNTTLNVNLRSQFFISRGAAKVMREGKWGRITNFISTAGLSGGLPGSIVYGISKSGAVAMTKNLARANGRYGVLVNALSPATLDTPLFRRGMKDDELADLMKEHLRINAFGRWTRPEEVAAAVLFLSSEMSSTVTGHVLRADSGAELAGL
jgi:NAD(P)-dependent dehydrogenase (short-subunit alcohol dehydrogenase family)